MTIDGWIYFNSFYSMSNGQEGKSVLELGEQIILSSCKKSEFSIKLNLNFILS